MTNRNLNPANADNQSSWFFRAAITGCLVAGGFFAARAMSSTAEGDLSTAATVSELSSSPELVTQNIEDTQLGQRVVGTNPLREETQAPSDIRPENWRAIRLKMVDHGVEYDLAFLRPLSWLESTGAQVGGSIHMELDEMGLNGPAEVLTIEPCPVIEPDDGTDRNVVTGTMSHPAPNVVYLHITGLQEPLGVTDTHPIWSETRQDFVKAGRLSIGEQFRTLAGDVATLITVAPNVGPPKMVYNLEVDAEHVYSVTANGLLVHNENCVSWVRNNIDEIGGEAVFMKPKVDGTVVGQLPKYEYGPAIRGGATADDSHAFIIKGGKLFDQKHPKGVNAAEWFGEFMAKNNYSGFDDLLDFVDITALAKGVK